MPGWAMAAGTIGAAGVGAYSANKAANTQADSANRAADLQLGMFNTVRGDLAPFTNAGAAALPSYMQLLGIPSGGGGYGGAPGTVSNNLVGGTQASAGPSPDFTGYLNANPDVRAEYDNMDAATKAMFPTAEAYAQRHYERAGKQEGRAISMLPAGTAAAPGTGDQMDWAGYLKTYPSIAAEYERQLTIKDGPKSLAEKGITSPESYAAWHYANFGQKEGLNVPRFSSGTGGAGGGQSLQSSLENLPGYKFARDQGMQSVENVLAGRGWGGVSGALGKGIGRFVTGLADQTYGAQVDRMHNLATLGQNSAAQSGTLGVQSAANAGGNIVGAGNAQAAGTLGVGSNIGGGLQLLGMYNSMKPGQFTPGMANNLINANPNLF